MLDIDVQASVENNTKGYDNGIITILSCSLDMVD